MAGYQRCAIPAEPDGGQERRRRKEGCRPGPVRRVPSQIPGTRWSQPPAGARRARRQFLRGRRSSGKAPGSLSAGSVPRCAVPYREWRASWRLSAVNAWRVQEFEPVTAPPQRFTRLHGNHLKPSRLRSRFRINPFAHREQSTVRTEGEEKTSRSTTLWIFSIPVSPASKSMVDWETGPSGLPSAIHFPSRLTRPRWPPVLNSRTGLVSGPPNSSASPGRTRDQPLSIRAHGPASGSPSLPGEWKRSAPAFEQGGPIESECRFRREIWSCRPSAVKASWTIMEWCRLRP